VLRWLVELPAVLWRESPCCRETAVAKGLTAAFCLCIHIYGWEITYPFLTPNTYPEKFHN